MLDRNSLAAIAVPLSLLASCAASREHLTPLAALRDVPVTFHATLAPRAGEAPTAPAPAEPAPQIAVAAPADVERVEITCRWVRVRARTLHELLPAGERAAHGVVVARAGVEALVPRLHELHEVALVSAPRIVLGERGAGLVRVANDTSFVRGFGLELVGGVLMVDPEIAVVREGFSVHASGRVVSGDVVELDLELASASLVRPIAERVVALPGSNAPVSIQTPITFEQRMSARTALGEDELLLLAGFVDRDGTPLVACVSGRRVTAGSAARAYDAAPSALAAR